MVRSVVVVIGLSAVLAAGCSLGGRAADPLPLTGLVVDTEGVPIVGAQVAGGDQETRTDGAGEFSLGGRGVPAWISVEAGGFVGRTRAASPGSPVLLRLTPDAGATVSLHFAGDVMAGRRFYDRDEDGERADGQLRLPATVEDHRALLGHIEPLLADADLSVVNLESPLTNDPWYDIRRQRPPSFHPTKEFAFSSDTLTADALRAAGVDVVDLGNNHLYDRLRDGVTDTIEALDAAGVVHFGAGADDDAAWRPAMVTRKGQRLAFLGCTTILGDEHPITYVATPEKGGAAACDEERLRIEVAAAAGRSDAVVVMIHGGFEYDPVPSRNVAALTVAAREAGARLVVNHHPHVVGGLDWDGDSLAALNMGNFLFDQTIWQTFQSYLLSVHLRGGDVVRAYAEPIIVDDYTPRGLVGGAAARITRTAAGSNPGPFVMEDGAVEVDLGGLARASHVVEVARAEDQVLQVADGLRVVGTRGGAVRFGRNLLFVGDFEDEDVDDEQDEADFWEVQPGRQFGDGFGVRGSNGARITRRRDDVTDAFVNPAHRILLDEGTEVSVVGLVRAPEGAEVSVQLSWFPDTKGPSASQQIEEVDLTGARVDGWAPFRMDATAPPGTVAVGSFVRLSPPLSADEVTADVDELALVEWSPAGTPPDARHTHLVVRGASQVSLSLEHLPGGEAWAHRVRQESALAEAP